MKFVSIVLLALACSVAMAAPTEPREYDLEQAPQLFEKFIKDYNRSYQDEDDKQEHYKAFVSSLTTINESNKRNPTATFGINKFADYTPEEKKSMFGLKKN